MCLSLIHLGKRCKAPMQNWAAVNSCVQTLRSILKCQLLASCLSENELRQAHQDDVCLKGAVVAGHIIVWHSVVVSHSPENGACIVAGGIDVFRADGCERAAGKGIWGATGSASDKHGCQNCV